jgi:hypothetical protein
MSQSQHEVQLNFSYPDIAYADRFGPSGKRFRAACVLYIYILWLIFFPHLSNTCKELCINVLAVRK